VAVEDRYNWEQFSLEELRKKKHPLGYFAYGVSYNRDMKTYPGKPLHVMIILDCDGAPVPRTVSGEIACGFTMLCPGAEWVTYHWTARYMWTTHKSPGIILDYRSWLMIVLGCCPKFEEYF